MNKKLQIKIQRQKNKLFVSFIFLSLLTLYGNVGYATANVSPDVSVEKLIQQRRISLNYKNQTAKFILSDIEKLTGIGYVIKSNVDPKLLNNLSINVNNVTIEQALNTLLAKTDCTYVIDNKIILIIKKQQSSQSTVKVNFNGKVVVKGKNTPVIGATIIVKGTNKGAISNEKGEFSIPNLNDGDEVEVAYLGLKGITVRVTPQSKLYVIELEEDALNVDDVVITGIFTRKKESFTGSAATMNKKDLQRTGSQNIFQSLKNLDPTLNILDNVEFGSDPNKLPDMELRGTSSFPDVKNSYISNPNLPLFILDGFETTVEKVYDLDMNRVESVTILKDAAAKAIYGSKAANGVIVIETTQVKTGELRLSYNGNINMEMPDLSSYNLCNAREKLDLENQLGLYHNKLTSVDLKYQQMYEKHRNNVENGVNTDWLAQPVRMGIGHKHGINLEVGTSELKVGVDLSYNKVQGAMRGSSREVMSGGLTFIYRYKNVLFRNQLSILKNNAINSPYGSFSDYAAINPYWKMKDENGNYLKVLGESPVFSAPVYNPLYNTTLNTKSETEYLDITDNLYIEYNINNSLKLTGRLGVTKKSDGSEEFLPGSHLKFQSVQKEEFFNKGSFSKGNGENFSISGDLNLNYNKSFGKHIIFGNAGLNIREASVERYLYSAQGFPNDKMDNIIFAKQYTLGQKPTGVESIDREIGALLVGNYSYDDRYLADVSYRATASSQFGSDKRWGGFWAAGLGWNVHNEKFIKSSKVINQLRLRFSVGNTGSQNFNSYQSMLLYNYFLDEVYLDRIGTYLEALSNSDLKWQKKMDYNYGVDIRLWDRFDIRLEYYRAFTNDLLTDITLPPSSGFDTYKANLGQIENVGYEFKLNYSVLPSVKDTYLSLFASGAANKNKIKKISNSLKTMTSDQDKESASSNKPLTRFEEGQSLNSIWAVRSLGIDPATGKEIFLTKDGNCTDVWNVDDKVVCGDNQPKIQGTFGFNFERKGLGVSVTMRYRLGGQVYNQTLIDKVENASLNNNVDKRAYYNSWMKENDHKLFRTIGDWNHPTLATSRFVQDLDELDISAISLSYDFYRHNFVKKCGLERLKLAVNMNDVCKFSSIKVERGTSYPFARFLSFSLQVNF